VAIARSSWPTEAAAVCASPSRTSTIPTSWAPSGALPTSGSAERPIFDERRIGLGVVYDSKGGFRGLERPLTVLRLEGFAADGVATVALLMPDGRIEAVTPVEDNVYHRLDALPTEPIAGIVDLDPEGHRICTQCIARGGCEK